MKNMVVALVVASLLIVSSSAAAYTIDGKLDDWGLDLTNDWSLDSTWVPNQKVYFYVEDNVDPAYVGYANGVHIKGVGSYYTYYSEPKVLKQDGTWVTEPYGNEPYDLEAIYFDQDDQFMYVAVVTSEAPDALGDKRPADLALNLDRLLSTGEFGFEYGIKLGSKTGLEQFAIYLNPDWEEPFYVPNNKPTVILDGTKVGNALGVYSELSGVNDNGEPNYIIELAIPKSDVGNPTNPALLDMHLSEGCGNDHIPLPEFPLVFAGLILLISPAFAYLLVKKH